MEVIGVPVIVVCCYVLGEVYKLMLKKHQEAYKYIPIFLSMIGGILGIIIHLTCPNSLFEASNIWIALFIGMISGASSTGANQIIKQIFKKGERAKDEKTSME